MAINWIKRNTRPGQAFLASIGASPLVLTYAGRPVLLQPKFESEKIREKAKDFNLLLYATEDEFYGYCRKHDASYFLYEPKLALDNSIHSYRYMADSLSLRRTSPAYLFHFFPEKLNHFELVYQNQAYRIFKIVRRRQPAVREMPYQPIFDIALYEKEIKGEYFNDSGTAEALRNLFLAIASYESALKDLNRGQIDSAIASIERALALHPNLLPARATLGRAYAQKGDLDKALAECEKELLLDPDSFLAYYGLGHVYAERRMFAESVAALEAAVYLAPQFAEAKRMLEETKARLTIPDGKSD